MENTKTNTRGSFEALDPNKPIFKEIKKQKPKWWKLFIEDKELYIEIRKDNYIDVYHYGGRLAKITSYNETKKKFFAKIHPKYKGLEGERDISLDLESLDEQEIGKIKERIRTIYLEENKEEKNLKEKRIQGEMIIDENSNYIDSEFQYNKSENSRIDLTELSDGELSFVELKLINNGDLNKNIIEQMKRYKDLIDSQPEKKIIDYYKKIIKLKNDLGIFKEKYSTDFKLNKIPKLIIVNTYKKEKKEPTEKQKQRISRIKDLLDKNNIDYREV